MTKNEMSCLRWGGSGDPISKVSGSLVIELLCWMFFILPGVVYTISRYVNRVKVCPCCKGVDLIPYNSPAAKINRATMEFTNGR